MDETRLAFIGFNLVKGIGAVRTRLLLQRFGSLEAAWRAPASALAAAGLSQRIVAGVLQVRSSGALDRAVEIIEKLGVEVLTWDDPAYPPRLKEIDQPPPVLYVRGDIRAEDELAVAVVGTRRITSYGRQAAEEIAGFLAHNGLTVVSGLARGVDAVAHKAALQAGGRTLAVLGSGVDQIYPPEHAGLAEKICTAGAVLSDYPPGAQPEGANFPPRNRIISGLSLAVVVIEAGEKSGALITASFAADQGRDVFAVPGGIHAPQSAGANRLIQQGAYPVTKPKDILDALKMEQVSQFQAARRALPADPTEARLLALIRAEPRHVDEIGAQADMPIAQVSALLTMMELKGLVRQVGGMSYVAARENLAEYDA